MVNLIKCNVKECKYNCEGKKCELENVVIGHQKNSTKTCCQSFVDEKL